jgi:hypothetical protein
MSLRKQPTGSNGSDRYGETSGRAQETDETLMRASNKQQRAVVVAIIATEEQATLTQQLAASSLQTAITRLFLQRSQRRLTDEFQHNPRCITSVNMITLQHIFTLFTPLFIYTVH